jgi:starch-binding outer membrane protein, SusD/RagB family
MSRVSGFWRRHASCAIGAIALGGALACTNVNIPDLNNSSIAGFQTNPTASGASALIQAMIAGERDETATSILTVGSIGREGYNLSVSNGTLPYYLIGPLLNSTGFLVGTGGSWSNEYTNIRTAELVLDNTSKISGLSAAQAAAMTGFVQTMEAYDFYNLAVTHDSLGLPIAVDISPTAPAPPIAARAAVFQHIYNLLDSGATNLAAGGAAFPFALATGFTGFSTPATFVPVNRALRARVDIFLNDFPTALTDLAASFVSTASPLTTGVYFNFSTTSGDEQNSRFLDAPVEYASPRMVDSAQLQPGGAPDLRTSKVTAVAPFTFDGITSHYLFTLYPAGNTPVPLVRNEELILLRAEAELGTGDNADWLNDINFIRQNSGGLAPVTLGDFASPNAQLEETLYEERYSLWWEGSHAWISYKHYNKLGELPAGVANGHIFNVMPFPQADCNSYTPTPAGCAPVVGVPGAPNEEP